MESINHKNGANKTLQNNTNSLLRKKQQMLSRIKNLNKLMFVITRQFILGFISIFVNQFWFIFFTVAWGYVDNYNPDPFYGSLAYLIRSIQGLINLICLYLSFKIHSKTYYKVCKCCHQRCRKCCIRTNIQINHDLVFASYDRHYHRLA